MLVECYIANNVLFGLKHRLILAERQGTRWIWGMAPFLSFRCKIEYVGFIGFCFVCFFVTYCTFLEEAHVQRETTSVSSPLQMLRACAAVLILRMVFTLAVGGNKVFSDISYCTSYQCSLKLTTHACESHISLILEDTPRITLAGSNTN